MNSSQPFHVESAEILDPRLLTPEALPQLLGEVKERCARQDPRDLPWLIRASEVLLAGNSRIEVDARVRTANEVGKFLYARNDSYRALQIATLAVNLARRSEAAPTLRFALNRLGAWRADLFDIAGALEAYAEALDLARKQGDPEGECSVLINLGSALSFAGQYAEALLCYMRAARLTETIETKLPLRASVFINIAKCHEFLGEAERGLEAIETVLADPIEPSDTFRAFNRVVQECNYSSLLLSQDRIPEAQERFEIARRFAQLSGAARAQIELDILEGRLRVRRGDGEGGVKILEDLVGRLGGFPSYRKEALLALVEANERAGRPDRALATLWQLADFMRGVYQETLRNRLPPASGTHVGHLDEDPSRSQELTRRESALRTQLAARDNARAHLEMLERMAVSSGLREDPKGEAAYRIGTLSSLLAAATGKDGATCAELEIAARLHDIGKAFIPDHVLLKAGELSAAEREIIRSHAKEGAAFLAASGFSETHLAEEVALYHHERWDGSGYPRKVAGDAIPWSARVVALADAFDAMTHERPYARRLSVEDALAEIRAEGERQFDPELALRFEVLIRELQATHANLDIFLAQPASASSLLQVRARISRALEASGSPA